MPCRAIRVWAYCFAIALMNLVDLWLTITYVKPGWLIEGNPLSEWVMQHGPIALSVWKILCVLSALAILIGSRLRLCGELASIFCTAVMLVLMLHWANVLMNIH